MHDRSLETPAAGVGDLPPAGTPGPIFLPYSAEETARMRAMKSFRFRHALAESPLLGLARVREATETLLRERRYGQVLFTSGLPGSGPEVPTDASSDGILAALDDYGMRKAWLRLTRADEVIPELGDVVERFYADLSGHHGWDVRPEVFKTFVTLFVSSPGTVTPYHIDHTWNYLLQVRGRKTVELFDADDPRVLTQIDRENWYAQGTLVARRPGVSGVAYEIGPGDGVHHPVNAPHLVRNGTEISVSLSLGLCLRRSTREANVHQFNYMLRRLGLKPRPPRASAWVDTAKSSLIRMVSDRRPKTFEDVLFSGMRRIRGVMKGVGLGRFANARKVEIT